MFETNTQPEIDGRQVNKWLTDGTQMNRFIETAI